MSETEGHPDTAPAKKLTSEEMHVLAGMVMQLFAHWNLSAVEQAALLGLTQSGESSLEHFRQGKLIDATHEVWGRVDDLLGIHGLLRLLFPQNRDIAYRWMSIQNRAFEGRTPVAVVRAEGANGLRAVRAYLAAAAGS